MSRYQELKQYMSKWGIPEKAGTKPTEITKVTEAIQYVLRKLSQKESLSKLNNLVASVETLTLQLLKHHNMNSSTVDALSEEGFDLGRQIANGEARSEVLAALRILATLWKTHPMGEHRTQAASVLVDNAAKYKMSSDDIAAHINDRMQDPAWQAYLTLGVLYGDTKTVDELLKGAVDGIKGDVYNKLTDPWDPLAPKTVGSPSVAESKPWAGSRLGSAVDSMTEGMAANRFG